MKCKSQLMVMVIRVLDLEGHREQHYNHIRLHKCLLFCALLERNTLYSWPYKPVSVAEKLDEMQSSV